MMLRAASARLFFNSVAAFLKKEPQSSRKASLVNRRQ